MELGAYTKVGWSEVGVFWWQGAAKSYFDKVRNSLGPPLRRARILHFQTSYYFRSLLYCTTLSGNSRSYALREIATSIDKTLLIWTHAVCDGEWRKKHIFTGILFVAHSNWSTYCAIQYKPSIERKLFFFWSICYVFNQKFADLTAKKEGPDSGLHQNNSIKKNCKRSSSTWVHKRTVCTFSQCYSRLTNRLERLRRHSAITRQGRNLWQSLCNHPYTGRTVCLISMSKKFNSSSDISSRL